MISKKTIGNECPRCSDVETWDYVVKYKETIPLRQEFVKKMLKELCNNRLENIDEEEILSFVEDILRYLEDNSDNEYEINQGILGMKNIFRGYVVKVWKGANFAQNKY